MEANLKKSSTINYKIHNEYQFSTFSLHSQINHLHFHRKKVCLSIFSHGKYFVPRFSIFIFRENPRLNGFRDEFWALNCTKTGKNQNNIIKKINKMLIYWSVPDRLVTPGTESLTRHIDLLDAVTHTHLQLANLAVRQN